MAPLTAHPSLVLDLDPKELDRLRPQEPLARIRQRASRCIHCHLSIDQSDCEHFASIRVLLVGETPRLTAHKCPRKYNVEPGE